MATIEEALHQALANRDAGHLGIAESIYRAILVKFPQNAEAKQGLDDLLVAQGRRDDGSGLPQQTNINQLLACCNASKFSQAEESGALIARFPDTLILHKILTSSLLEQENANDTIKWFGKACNLEHGS